MFPNQFENHFRWQPFRDNAMARQPYPHSFFTEGELLQFVGEDQELYEKIAGLEFGKYFPERPPRKTPRKKPILVHAPDARVRIHGLQNAKELNGAVGVIERPAAVFEKALSGNSKSSGGSGGSNDNPRWIVTVLGRGEMSLKQSNLELLPPADEPASGGSSSSSDGEACSASEGFSEDNPPSRKHAAKSNMTLLNDVLNETEQLDETFTNTVSQTLDEMAEQLQEAGFSGAEILSAQEDLLLDMQAARDQGMSLEQAIELTCDMNSDSRTGSSSMKIYK